MAAILAKAQAKNGALVLAATQCPGKLPGFLAVNLTAALTSRPSFDELAGASRLPRARLFCTCVTSPCAFLRNFFPSCCVDQGLVHPPVEVMGQVLHPKQSEAGRPPRIR